jgi:hypothetical protein
LTTIIKTAALSTIHDITGRRIVSAIYSGDIYALTTPPTPVVASGLKMSERKAAEGTDDG